MGKLKVSGPQQSSGRAPAALPAPTTLDRFMSRSAESGEPRGERAPLPRGRHSSVAALPSAPAPVRSGAAGKPALRSSSQVMRRGETDSTAPVSPRAAGSPQPVSTSQAAASAEMMEQGSSPASPALSTTSQLLHVQGSQPQGVSPQSPSYSTPSWMDEEGSQSGQLSPSLPDPDMPAETAMASSAKSPAPTTSEQTHWAECFQQLPTKADFQALISEVRDACRQEIAVLRHDIQQVAVRVDDLESEHDSTRKYLSHVHPLLAAQSSVIRDMNRHLEDLDNRGRRNNIRLRGLPEVSGSENLPAILSTIFNDLLGKPSTHVIKLDRAHRALKPKNASALPRDVICCIHDFQLKEAIMLKARTRRNLQFEGVSIQLFPDLSWITLQKRRHMRPLLDILRDNQIPYRWNFPFALLARREGRLVTLKAHEDLQDFCKSLATQVPKMADWELGSLPSPPSPVWQTKSSKRRRSPGDALELSLPSSPHH